MRIFTGSYNNCKLGDLVSISGDKGRSVGFEGNSYTKLAPNAICDEKVLRVVKETVDKMM